MTVPCHVVRHFATRGLCYVHAILCGNRANAFGVHRQGRRSYTTGAESSSLPSERLPALLPTWDLCRSSFMVKNIARIGFSVQNYAG